MVDPAPLFHDRADRDDTHVVRIGIGGYSWLEGRAEYDPARTKASAMPMGEPAVLRLSIRRPVDWSPDPQGFGHADRPLASLTMPLPSLRLAGDAHPRHKYRAARTDFSQALTVLRHAAPAGRKS